MQQQAESRSTTPDDLNRPLRATMAGIHKSSVEYGGGKNRVDYVKGANITGFVKQADATTANGVT